MHTGITHAMKSCKRGSVEKRVLRACLFAHLPAKRVYALIAGEVCDAENRQCAEENGDNEGNDNENASSGDDENLDGNLNSSRDWCDKAVKRNEKVGHMGIYAKEPGTIG